MAQQQADLGAAAAQLEHVAVAQLGFLYVVAVEERAGAAAHVAQQQHAVFLFYGGVQAAHRAVLGAEDDLCGSGIAAEHEPRGVHLPHAARQAAAQVDEPIFQRAASMGGLYAMASTQHLEEGYRERFRELLARVEPRRLEFGVELLIERARARRDASGEPLERALASLYKATRERVVRREQAVAACPLGGGALPPAPLADPPRFVCDGSLGGLARWLRALGYEAVRVSGGGERARGEALRSGGVLLTSDVEVTQRRASRSATAPVLHVPVDEPVVEQLGRVMRAYGLQARAPRCMACGAALRGVAKERVRDRIPPRTARWKDDYFLCAGCRRLLWQGTHWQRITQVLAGLP